MRSRNCENFPVSAEEVKSALLKQAGPSCLETHAAADQAEL